MSSAGGVTARRPPSLLCRPGPEMMAQVDDAALAVLSRIPTEPSSCQLKNWAGRQTSPSSARMRLFPLAGQLRALDDGVAAVAAVAQKKLLDEGDSSSILIRSQI